MSLLDFICPMPSMPIQCLALFLSAFGFFEDHQVNIRFLDGHIKRQASYGIGFLRYRDNLVSIKPGQGDGMARVVSDHQLKVLCLGSKIEKQEQ